MTAKKVRLGFVGVGFMGQVAHLRNYATLPDVQIAAIAELRPKMARRVADAWGVPKVYMTAKEMLAKETLDGLVASQPFTRHGSLVPEILAAGVPVLTEKPLAAAVAVGEKIVDAAKKAGTWHMVGYHKRSDPATIYARAEIDRLKSTGELGALRYVRLVMPSGDWVAGGDVGFLGSDEPGPSIPEDPVDPSMDEATWKDYVAFVNYYIHQVNLMRHLLGEPYTVVFAEPSGVLFVGRSASGIACTLEMTPYTTTIDWQESALVCFEKGYVRLELPAPLASNRPGRVEILRDPGKGAVPTTTVPTLPWVHAMRQQAVNFVKAVRGETRPPCDSVEALDDLRVAREYIRLWKGR